tara:strand:- start:511 stop:1167 length:657 start_codon:yes stop_codon:yes gene_type:complete
MTAPSRFNTGSIFDALGKKTLRCYEALAIELRKKSDNSLEKIFITNAPHDVTISDTDSTGSTSNKTFTSVGAFLGFSQISEERLFTTSEITISLAGIPAFGKNVDDGSGNSVTLNFIQQFLNYNYVDQPVRIYRVFFDEDIANIGSMLMFDGRISAPVIEDDPADTTTVAATCASHWQDYERSNGVITNDNRQQSLYTGDRAFQYASKLIQDIKWQKG